MSAQWRDWLADFEKSGAQLFVVDPHDAQSAAHFLQDVGLEMIASTVWRCA